jgi:tripartite-type tricarboxylate transporter receptor subunit TctC
MKCVCGLIIAWTLALPVTDGLAQVYPTHPVRILTGFGAGSPPDIIARIVGNKLSEIWGKPTIVEDVTGASGNIAAERVAKANPDGYTLLLAVNSGIVIAPSLYEHITFNPLKDLAPISQVSSYPNALVVRKGIAAGNVQELVTFARLRPGALTFGSAGTGTTMHLAGELLKQMAGIDIQHVPYRGGVGAKEDLQAGRIDMSFLPIPELPLLPALPLRLRQPKLFAEEVRAGFRSLRRSA